MLQIRVFVAIVLADYWVTLPSPVPRVDFTRATLAQRAAPVLLEMRRK